MKKIIFAVLLAAVALVTASCAANSDLNATEKSSTTSTKWVSDNKIVDAAIVYNQDGPYITLTNDSLFLGLNDTSDMSTRTFHYSGSAVLSNGYYPKNNVASVLYYDMTKNGAPVPHSENGLDIIHTCNVYVLGYVSAPYYYSIGNVQYTFNSTTRKVDYSFDVIASYYYWRYAYIKVNLNYIYNENIGKVLISDLGGGNVKFSVTVSEKKQTVHIFARKNGIQDYDAIDIQNGGEVKNADGSYTYSVTRNGAYRTGDVVVARAFTYLESSGQIYYPGPDNSVWSAPVTIQ